LGYYKYEKKKDSDGIFCFKELVPNDKKVKEKTEGLGGLLLSLEFFTIPGAKER
jgi:hypothetical protein